MRPHDASSTRSRAVLAAIAECVDTTAIADTLAAALLDVVGGRHAHCVFYDSDERELWRPECATMWPATVGLVGAVARRGRALRQPQPSASTLFVPELDAPHGRRPDELLLVPIATAPEHTDAIVVLARERDDPPWAASVVDELEREAATLALGLAQWSARTREGETHVSAPSPAREPAGPPLRLVSPALAGAWFVSVALLFAALAVAPFVQLNRYSTGVAVVREPTRTEVLALAAGEVAGVHVRPGQVVPAGAPLVSLHDALARAEVSRLEHAWADELARQLLAGATRATGSNLAALRDQLDGARDRLRRTIIRAPRSGRVGELRVALDQPVAVGDRVVALVDGDAEAAAPQLIAMMPAADIDRFAPGQVLRYTPAGHPRTHVDIVVEAVDPVVVGPAEARRLLGDRVADGVPLDGAIAMVVAPLPRVGFVVDDQPRMWQDGMIGRAELRTGADSLLDLLLPLEGLR